ncbi:hypothetical protein WJX81_006176 [Elliptochloris bilobata]|uniref:Anaphase-promoting complex subunit 5 n=1 Tax=Elliptochloris bilobata TaxID=381761 RepID=A0AAW1QVJ6_9CHLO
MPSQADLPAGAGAWAGSVVTEQLRALACPDDLFTLFAELGSLTERGSGGAGALIAPEPSSALGMFLRHRMLAFHLLQYERTCQLFTDLRAYCDAAQHAGPYAWGVARGTPWRSGPELGPEQDPAALAMLLHRRLGAVPREAGKGPPSAAGALVADIRAAAPLLSQVHLLEARAALYAGDAATAVTALHRHFDYTGGASSKGGNDKGRLQTALLSLGAWHVQLGHVQGAVLALNEAVRVAQQHGDHTALAHVLAALMRLLATAAPPAAPALGDARAPGAPPTHHLHLLRLIRRCLKRGEELRLPHLVAYGRLALAHFALAHRLEPPDAHLRAERGLPAPETGAYLPLVEAGRAHRSVARLQAAAMPAAALLAAEPPTAPPGAQPQPARPGGPGLFPPATSPVFQNDMNAGSREAAAEMVEGAMASAHLLRGAAWRRSGAPSLAAAAALAHLAVYEDVASAEDRCLAYAQLAVTAVERQGYAAAERVLDAADEEFPFASSVPLRATRLGIAHSRAVARRDAHAATRVGAVLCSLAPPDDATSLPLRLEAEARNVEALIAAGRLEDAHTAASAHFALCLDAGMQDEAVRMLLLLADVHAAAGLPAAALPYALTARLHAQQSHADLLAADASVRVAAAMGALGDRTAMASLRAELPLLLGAAPALARARAQLTLAEGLLATASAAQLAADPDRVLQPLEAAAALFEGLEDWRSAAAALHLAAVVCQTVRRTAQRNAVAAGFCRMSARAEACC